MLLSTPNELFVVGRRPRCRGRIAFFSVILLLVGLAIDVCLLMKTSWDDIAKRMRNRIAPRYRPSPVTASKILSRSR